jgi:hypothetical protein
MCEFRTGRRPALLNEKVQRRLQLRPKVFLPLQLEAKKPPDHDEDVAQPNCLVLRNVPGRPLLCIPLPAV